MLRFDRRALIPSFWANALDDFLIPAAPNLTLRRLAGSATTVEVPAGPGEDRAALAIDGRWRFRETTVQRIHPGGVAGEFVVWATTGPNVIAQTPEPNTDTTNYSFDLSITAVGTTPAVVAGSVEFWREIGRLTWDGAAITSLRQSLGPTSSLLPQGRVAGRALVAGADGAPAWGQVGTPGVADNAITAAQIADAAVGTSEIADRAVTIGKLATSARTRLLMAYEAVPGAADAAVDSPAFGPTGGGVVLSCQWFTGFHGQSGFAGFLHNVLVKDGVAGTNHSVGHFFNVGGQHHAFIPRIINLGVLAAGSYVWRTSPNTGAAGGGTHWDTNDSVRGFVVEFTP